MHIFGNDVLKIYFRVTDYLKSCLASLILLRIHGSIDLLTSDVSYCFILQNDSESLMPI